MLERRVGDVEHAAFARDDGGHARAPHFRFRARLFHRAAHRLVEQFEPAADDVLAPLGLHRAHIGAVHPHESSLRVA